MICGYAEVYEGLESYLLLSLSQQVVGYEPPAKYIMRSTKHGETDLSSRQLGKLKSGSSSHLAESSHLNRSPRCQPVPPCSGPNNGDGVIVANVAPLVLSFKGALLENCLLRALGQTHLGKAGWRLWHLVIIDHDEGDFFYVTSGFRVYIVISMLCRFFAWVLHAVR